MKYYQKKNTTGYFVGVEVLPKYYQMYDRTVIFGMYGNNGKFNVTNGSSGQNGLYRLSGQREWAIN